MEGIPRRLEPMDAREYFEEARAAQRHIDGRLAAIRAMRERQAVRAQGYEVVGRSPAASDPLAATDELVDAERAARSELEGYEREVASAREVCRGIRRANPAHPVWGDVLELHYLELLGWADAGRYLGMTSEGARRAAYAALDWVDAVGLARARAGLGQAARF